MCNGCELDIDSVIIQSQPSISCLFIRKTLFKLILFSFKFCTVDNFLIRTVFEQALIPCLLGLKAPDFILGLFWECFGCVYQRGQRMRGQWVG